MKRMVWVPVCLALGACAPRAAAPSLASNAAAPAVVAAVHTTSAEVARPVAASFVGAGSLEARGEATPKTKLALQSVSVSAVTTGDVAETTVEHVFRNDADERLEGTFRFPVPDGAIVVGLAMEIDGRLMEGELVPRDKARKIYEETVDQMLDPALLEWENGTTFKLRVFPIEPKKDKRVVLRLVTPLHRAEGGLFFAWKPPVASAELPIERLRVTLDGKPLSSKDGRAAPSGELLAKVAEKAPAVVAEETQDGTYLVAHVRPELPIGAASPSKKPQALVVVCDRSRSMLEARRLQANVLERIVLALGPADRFTVLAGDVRARTLGGGLRAPDAESAKAATSFVDAIEPDGASDVGMLITAAGKAAAEARAQGFEPSVVYLGDATATWGETRAGALEDVARASLGSAAMHVVMLGKSSDETTARALTAATSGRLAKPRTEDEARRVAEAVAHARDARRVSEVVLQGGEGLDVPTAVPHTVYEGDEVDLALFVPKGKPMPALALVGTSGEKPFAQPIAIAAATKARDVGKRWATAKLAALGREGDAKKEEMVATSLAHGVMSKHTSFLVLESEEAYAKWNIERKAKQAEAAEAAVSGRDVDGDARTASVSPDHLQPGDPEVRIPAPPDAQSVVVVFPFGETKTAVFEDDAHGGAWVARFLVDRSTPDGTYEIVVRITLEDGRVELVKLPYVVDTKSPNLKVTTERKGSGAIVIHAKQELSEAEIAAQAPALSGTLEQRQKRLAAVLTDAKRVEVRTPDGQVLPLVHVRLGEFVGTWKPTGAATGKLRVVAVDRALNETVMEVEVR